MQVACLEFVNLPREVIEDRFHLEGDEGMSLEYLGGEASCGMFGAGLIYTNRDSLSVGVSVSVEDLPKKQIRINDVLENFKAHPAIRKLIRGGKTTEYSGHMIPEFGTKTMDSPAQNGCVFVGDTISLVNLSPFYHEGTNLAMGSGRIAAETLIELKEQGRDFTKENLQLYVQRLNASPIIADVKRTEWVPDLAHTAPELFDAWPQLFGELGRDWFKMNGLPKAEIQKQVRKRLFKEVGLLRGLKVAFQTRKLVM
jgi:electron transfer flavoprotein-quinone oxidoreductase